MADLKNRTQVIDDIQNIRAIMVIQKRSGLLIFNQIVSGKEKMEELLFSGFIQAIALFSAGLQILTLIKEIMPKMISLRPPNMNP